MLNKDERRSSRKDSSKYIVSHEVCVERGGGRKKCFFLLNVCLGIHMQRNEKMRYICVDGHGEAFSPEARHRLELLTGWGLGINHATAVSSAGAS